MKEKAKLVKPLTDVFTMALKAQTGLVAIKEFKFHDVRKWRFDYCILSSKVAIEVEGGVWTGGRHTRGKGFLGDCEKYNTATIMGYKVLRVTPDTLCNLSTFEMIIQAVNI